MPSITLTCDSRLICTVFSYGAVCFEDLTHYITVDKDRGGVVFHELSDFILQKHGYVEQRAMGIAPHPLLVLWDSEFPVEPSEVPLHPSNRIKTNRHRYSAWLASRICFLRLVQPIYDTIEWVVNLHGMTEYVFERAKHFGAEAKALEEGILFEQDDHIEPVRIADIHICDFQCACDELEPLI